MAYDHDSSGATASNEMGSPSLPKASSHIRRLFCALKVAGSAGVRLKLSSDRQQDLDQAKCPWFYPMRLSIKELVGLLGLPLGDEELPGVYGASSEDYLTAVRCCWLRLVRVSLL